MANQYSFIGIHDLKGRMFVYQEEMKEFDLNSEAIRSFAHAIRSGDVETLEVQFKLLDQKQKEGLLKIYIDYKNLHADDFMDSSLPRGDAISVARQFGHLKVVAFLTNQKNNLGGKKQYRGTLK
ncbi:MAG: hypothetical protein V4501_03365 [Pseudomonadota bacterium]